MIFTGILFGNNERCTKNKTIETEMPPCFVDLNLDQIIHAITAPKEEYNLTPFYYTILNSIDDIVYRQKIMQDIENTLYHPIGRFAENMCEMRKYLVKSEKFYYKYQQESCFLDAADIYCDLIETLYSDLTNAKVKSQGFLLFTKYLANYLQSESFISLREEVKTLKTALSSIQYRIRINGLRVQVVYPNAETNYGNEIETVFAKFREGAVKDYLLKYSDPEDMNAVEAQILDGVAYLYPDIFSRLDIFCEKHPRYWDDTIVIFDREVQFYMAYIDYIENIRQSGLKFCYPEISDSDKKIHAFETFDLALAKKLVEENTTVVVNDFSLRDKERIMVVSGPNQGGKTTFARTFGQLHFLACLGLPVPGKEARLFLPDKIFTHFEKEENIKSLNGKLQEELIRIYTVLQQATPNSIVILNEIFNSTTLTDQIFLSKKIMEKLIHSDLLGVWVTFIDEIASFAEQTVSMVSAVDRENQSLRTYKIERKPANGLVYALSIARKYRLTYRFLKERLNK
ncbi:MAG: hypothetical protein FWF53_12050 [Candidatus Azobacteroides sp.]|nr:hypothetical protein [Candidatus Azobacteroides sp.]